ncbi:MAG: S1 RNA-binding domain-containing protein [Chloroflexi bacterium]|nr:S1 RNA-binding domain-containing protein [Chloroflexota bacterium]
MQESQQNEGRPRPPRVIKRLSQGMKFEGTVRSVAEFGAFVDIGAGRDGLVHVSEMSRRTVAKPSDVVKEGDKVTVWVKDLDRERNRISLTMVDPETPGAETLQVGATVRGRVTRMMPYGAFVDIGVERDALLHVREMGDGTVERPGSVVHPGDEIDVRIVNIDAQRKRIDVSIRTPGEDEDDDLIQAVEQPEEEFGLTPMQLAMEKALQRQQKAERPRKRKKERPAADTEMDEIIRRTLESHRES